MIDIKIVRLKSGQDVIAGIELDNLESSSELKLFSPMTIIFRRASSGSTLMMLPWLPVELIEENNATIFADEVMTIIQPKTKLISYYQDVINIHLIKWLEAENILDFIDDEQNEMYEEEDESDLINFYDPKSDLLH